ncbi:hypothetical protein ILYODFUR_023590 [Ilyodon furcidens]|uniref:Uncharacterized protein n=1 Tax=Ilyodon furcidens TaxID=33524 RepID=A0ABV0VGR2_9TELE
MCEGPDRESEADEKRKENKEREEREALRCAQYPISTQYPSRAWKNTIPIMYEPYNSVCSSTLSAFRTVDRTAEIKCGWMKAGKQYHGPRVSESQICSGYARCFLFLKTILRCLMQDRE